MKIKAPYFLGQLISINHFQYLLPANCQLLLPLSPIPQSPFQIAYIIFAKFQLFQTGVDIYIIWYNYLNNE